ncbi:MAG: hypothetical protein FWG18_02940, partial [Alphaproteobacteria bacterium]|nr:hypothetical protein [Alphaproteobacteria bacterium]
MIKTVPVSKRMLAELAECFRAAYAPLGENWSKKLAIEFLTLKFKRHADLCFAAVCLDKTGG